MLPEGWAVVSLGEVAKTKIVYGIVQAGPHDPTGIPYIKSSDVGGSIRCQSLQKTSIELHRRFVRSTVVPGDIVFSLRGNTGATSVVPPTLPEANLTQGTAKISVSPFFDRDFIRFQIASQAAQRKIQAVTKGSTFVEITLEDLRKIQILCPEEPAEQRKIAEILSTWDQAIEAVEKLIANARAQKAALMQQLLTGTKRLPGFSGAWTLRTLGEICSPKQWPTIGSKDMQSSGYPVFGANSFIGFYHQPNHLEDTIIISCRGTCGEVLIVPGPAYITGNAMCLDGIDETKIVKSLLVELIRAKGTKSIISGSAQPQIVRSSLTKFKISVPTFAEQRRLGEVIEDSQGVIDGFEADATALRQEKSALMQQLLTGKRRVMIDQPAALKEAAA